MFALPSHPSNSMSKNIALIDSFIQILGYFITILINVSWGSISIVDGVLYPISCSFVLVFWHNILYYFWSVKLHYIIQQWQLFFYYIFFFILLNCNLIHLSLQTLSRHAIHFCYHPTILIWKLFFAINLNPYNNYFAQI
jgi:hypothetical protein